MDGLTLLKIFTRPVADLWENVEIVLCPWKGKEKKF